MVSYSIISKSARTTQVMEQYRSGHNGHDWKSCVPQKGTEGSNPSCSARIKTPEIERFPVFFCVYSSFNRYKCYISSDLKLAFEKFPLGFPLIGQLRE